MISIFLILMLKTESPFPTFSILKQFPTVAVCQQYIKELDVPEDKKKALQCIQVVVKPLIET